MSDVILYWNDAALEANRLSHTDADKNEQTGPTASSRALAIVHAAMYEAYAGAKGSPSNLPPFLPAAVAPVPPKGKISAAAAAAAAAHATLSALYTQQKATFDAKHAKSPGVAGGDALSLQNGHAFGLEVAAALLALRKPDPPQSSDGYAASQAPGAHRQDPSNPDQGFNAPFYGSLSRNFGVSKRHTLSPPPAPDSPEFLASLRQVREKGIAPELIGTLPPNSNPRTPSETLAGIFWGYDGAAGLGTPPRLYNLLVREVAKAHSNNEEQNARLFALVNVAMADAGILAWEQKYVHDLWRPVLAIREGDASLGAAAAPRSDLAATADPGWMPLGAPSTNSSKPNFTPPFPSYPSGHATFGAAALHITRLFYGVKPATYGPDDLLKGVSFVSEEFNGVSKDNRGIVRPRHVRAWEKGLWGALLENSFSRVLLGVHWDFDGYMVDSTGQPVLTPGNGTVGTGGVPLGLAIAEDVFASGLRYSGLPPTPPPRRTPAPTQ